MEDIVATIRVSYPQLRFNYVPGESSTWVVIHRSEMVANSPSYPPTYDLFLVLTMESRGVTYDFRTSIQSIEKGPFSWVKVPGLSITFSLVLSKCQYKSNFVQS